jgi:hypothetical protein
MKRHGLSITAVITEMATLPIMGLDCDPADDARFDDLSNSRQGLLIRIAGLRRSLGSPRPGIPQTPSRRRALRGLLKGDLSALKTARDIGPRAR